MTEPQDSITAGMDQSSAVTRGLLQGPGTRQAQARHTPRPGAGQGHCGDSELCRCEAILMRLAWLREQSWEWLNWRASGFTSLTSGSSSLPDVPQGADGSSKASALAGVSSPGMLSMPGRIG